MIHVPSDPDAAVELVSNMKNLLSLGMLLKEWMLIYGRKSSAQRMSTEDN